MALKPISATMAIPTWTRIAPRSERLHTLTSPSSLRPVPGLPWVLDLRTIDRSTAAFQLPADPFVGRQESIRQRRQGGHLLRVQWAHQPRSDQAHQLISLGTNRLALKQVADDRQSRETRYFAHRIL